MQPSRLILIEFNELCPSLLDRFMERDWLPNFQRFQDLSDAYTTDASGLAGERLRLANSDDHIILPEVISKEPLGPAVRHGDDQWFDIVKWTHFAMINAEELGIDSKNISDALKSKKPDVMRFVGTEGEYGEELGLTKD